MERKGFTLVEMLVVIVIIGILASMTAAAAIVARRRAKIAATVIELKQIEMACQAYKEKFGEYPPDFAGVNRTDDGGAKAKSAVIRHLARAFPRYNPGGWTTLRQHVATEWKINIDNLSPAGALTFWLGGKPVWIENPTNQDTTLADGTTKVYSAQPVSDFSGFSANPLDPFDNSASRIKPFYDFSLACLKHTNAAYTGLFAWPTSASDQQASPLVYFRAENGNYTTNGLLTSPSTYRKQWTFGAPQTISVLPAANWKMPVAANALTWINPQSFQIFSSGLDMTYGNVTRATGMPLALTYPTGEKYEAETYDDITNFSGGTLEDKMP